MTTDVKWFSSEMAGAPQISGSAQGSLLSMIDACLVDGFGLKTASSVTVAAGVATVVLNANNFFQHQIVLVAGATPAGLNGEKRVLALTGASSFTFDATGVADGVAAGTITVKTAPLGWLKAFAGTNTGAYKINKTLHPDSTDCLVRIADTYTYSAQICGYESMTGIDTGSAPFPTAAQTLLYVPRSNSNDATARTWFVVGDGRFVYVGIKNYTSSTASAGPAWFGFGEFKSKKTADPYRFAVSGNLGSDGAGSTMSQEQLISGSCNVAYVVRSYTGLGGSVKVNNRTWPMNYDGSGGSNGPIPYPNGPDYGLYLCPMQLFETALPCYRGDWPGVYSIPQNVLGKICPSNKTAYLDTDVPGFAGKVVGFFASGWDTTQWGVVAFDLTGPWEH